MRDGAVRLADGRMLGYTEWGDPAGAPVVFCHGAPASRRLTLGNESSAAALGVRLVSVDRPGFGSSDFQPGRRLLDWPADVAALADHLDLARFAVGGVSAGGKYALACGVTLPDRVTAVGVVAGTLPVEWYPDDELADLAGRDPGAAWDLAHELMEGLAADIDGHVTGMARRPGPDGAIYAQPDVMAQFSAAFAEAFRSGAGGPAHDLLLANRPWGFALADVAVPVHWWHGALDPVTSLPVVERALAGLAHYQLTVYRDEGHTIGFTQGEEILTTLAAC